MKKKNKRVLKQGGTLGGSSTKDFSGWQKKKKNSRGRETRVRRIRPEAPAQKESQRSLVVQKIENNQCPLDKKEVPP